MRLPSISVNSCRKRHTPPSGTQRQIPRPGSGNCEVCGAKGHGDHCYQHGRSRHRYCPRRGCCGPWGVAYYRHGTSRISAHRQSAAGGPIGPAGGDPGSSQFYVSLEDDLMRLFGSERIMGIMDRLGWEEHQAIDHPPQISRAIENAQNE